MGVEENKQPILISFVLWNVLYWCDFSGGHRMSFMGDCSLLFQLDSDVYI